MKTRYALLGLGTLALVGLMTTATPGDIVGSAHDFSQANWSNGEICKPCHTPHNAMVDEISAHAPLWNHALPDANTTYTMYEGDFLRDDALDPRSILCMGCHDGTVALDSYGGATGVQFIQGDENLGTDLTDDHPVGRDAIYPDVPWMAAPSTWENQPHGFTLEDMIVDGNPERVVSCVTCHEPHNRTGFDHLLWKSQSASGLCLTCHIK